MTTDIRIKRAYRDAANVDGTRILVDRLWPRGVSKEELRLTDWNKAIAPSDALRERFHDDPDKWDAFCRDYADELDQNSEAVEDLMRHVDEGRVTLVYGAKDEEHNNAVALKTYIEKRCHS